MNRPNSRPDLSILIKYDNRHLSFMVDGDPNQGLIHKEYSPLKLLREPEQYFRVFLDQLDNRAQQFNRNPDEVDNFNRLGLNLFQEVLPRGLRQLLWDRRNDNLSLQIQTDEPWIPWELCKLEGQGRRGPEAGAFLCEAFDMTRWYVGVPAATTIPLQRMAMVVPKANDLPRARLEAEEITQLLEGHTTVDRLDAELPTINRAMESGLYDAWHIASHGRQSGMTVEDAAAIELDDANMFTPGCVVGPAKRMMLPKPLVFLNNCYSGRASYTLRQQNGWAWWLIHGSEPRGGASAVIGTLWPVEDEAAKVFATRFYKYLLAGQPLAQAARSARFDVRELGGSSWLAYTVYGNPSANLERPVDWAVQWQVVREHAGERWTSLFLPVLLTTIAVAEPVPLTLLASFSGVSRQKDLASALAFWDTYTRLRMDGEPPLFKLSDPALETFVRQRSQDRGSEIDLTAVHDRIATLLHKTLLSEQEDANH